MENEKIDLFFLDKFREIIEEHKNQIELLEHEITLIEKKLKNETKQSLESKKMNMNRKI